MNFLIHAMHQIARADNFTICYGKKQIDVLYKYIWWIVTTGGICDYSPLIPFPQLALFSNRSFRTLDFLNKLH